MRKPVHRKVLDFAIKYKQIIIKIWIQGVCGISTNKDLNHHLLWNSLIFRPDDNGYFKYQNYA